MKRLLKKLVPRRLRLLRYSLGDRLRYLPNLVSHLGKGRTCPFCGWEFREFLPSGFDYPVLIEKRVIAAGSKRRDVVCPRCQSNARERLLYLYIQRNTDLLSGSGRSSRLLHVAPEPQLQRLLMHSPGLRYFGTDLERHPRMSTMFLSDLTNLPQPDHTFDAILCSHVLEHIPDDRAAMRELFRVLKPGGWAILQVPIALGLPATHEDPSVTGEEDRIREFGQRDHVRLYALDYLDRLRETGFTVQIFRSPEEFGPEAVRLYGVDPEEDLYIARKH